MRTDYSGGMNARGAEDRDSNDGQSHSAKAPDFDPTEKLTSSDFGRWTKLGAAVLVTLLTITATTLGIIAYFSKQPEPISFSNDQLQRIGSPLYNFSFLAPKTWSRTDPGNSDGYTFTDPDDENVTLRAFGSYNVFFLTEDEDTVVEKEILRRQELIIEDGGQISKSRRDGQLAISEDNSRYTVPGWSFQYEKGSATTLVKMVYDSDRFVYIEAQAPTNSFDRYEQAYRELLAELMVYEMR